MDGELTASQWDELAAASWRRVRLRDSSACCAVFGTPLQPAEGYYVRPAYTDGRRWLSERGYAALRHHMSGEGAPARRYGRRPPP
jgi:hypothetical protein